MGVPGGGQAFLDATSLPGVSTLQMTTRLPIAATHLWLATAKTRAAGEGMLGR
jgi:hypothetical protein